MKKLSEIKPPFVVTLVIAKVQECDWSAGIILIRLSPVNLFQPLLKTCRSEPRNQET